MWYVIQTITGKEQELLETIENVLAENKKEEIYQRCFMLQRECIWRIEGEFRVHIEPLFPSYVFVETDDPDTFFIALKQVPKFTKLLGAEGSFWGVGEEEAYLHSMMEAAERTRNRKIEQYLVRCSRVHVDAEGQIISAEGILKNYMNQIVKQRLRKRSVIIEVPFLGELRRIQLGIRLEEDAF